MNLQEAISLIEPGIFQDDVPQHWADLGCGNGTFTYALARLLAAGSSITAVDSSPQELIVAMDNGVSIQFEQMDFNQENIRLPKLDGILLANSFHYISQKELLIKRLEKFFNRDKQFLIIEYESKVSNPWVPYPITFSNLSRLFDGLGYASITKINERSSSFGGKMYVALIETPELVARY